VILIKRIPLPLKRITIGRGIYFAPSGARRVAATAIAAIAATTAATAATSTDTVTVVTLGCFSSREFGLEHGETGKG
jgi:hypothetical protein